MATPLLSSPILSSTVLTPRLTPWLPGLSSRISDWTLEQLNILPYQHLLEIGYGSGRTMQTVARKLKTGFIAGIDDSITMYQRAYRRNKKVIEQHLLQLHVGSLHDLPYPAHYFHTIYSANSHPSWKDPQAEFMRLSNLLKTGGRLVMVLQLRWPRKNSFVSEAVEQIQNDYTLAGLTDIRLRYQDTDPTTVIAVTGQKS